ncbi:MAG TPA: hypothetical protein VMM82_13700, partial [Spirochaetia bacterium]|nr:hypothetical protein [Spirochaetia bacterium]
PRRLLGLAMDGGDPVPVLDDLEDRELIFMERSVPDIEYSFKHVLMQEAIYESLPSTLRKELHRKVAEAFQQLSPTSQQEYCESLAYHYDRAADVAKAIHFYFLSGEKARRSYANAAAVTFFQRGLELLRASPAAPTSQDRELEFLIALGVPLVLARGHQDPTVEEVHLRAMALCQERGTPAQLFQVNLGLNRYYSFDRKRLVYGHQMLDIAKGADDAFLISRAHMMLSESYFYLADFEKTASHAEQGSQTWRPEHSPRDLVQFGNDTAAGCLLERALGLWCLGLPVTARNVMSQALQRARTVGHAFTLAFSLFYSGVLAFMLREQEEARALSNELACLARREGFAFYIANGMVLEGWVRNDPDMIRTGIGMLPRRPFPCLYACMHAEAHLAAGEAEQAIQVLEEALTVIRETHLHLWEPEVNRMRGQIGHDLGEPNVDVQPWLERALKLS